MNTILRNLRTPVPQSRPYHPSQVRNAAGGFVFQISPKEQLRRYLMLGSEGGTYYESETAVTDRGIELIKACAETLPAAEYFEEVIGAAESAPKRTYALFALAVAMSVPDPGYKDRAVAATPLVCKTGTDFFELISYIEATRGWGAVPRKALNAVLLNKHILDLALWTVKYRDRFGWTWRDALRIAHPKSRGSEDELMRGRLFDVMLGKDQPFTGLLKVDGWNQVKKVQDPKEILRIVNTYGLPWEALTDEQRTPEVWKACLPHIGNQAVLRNLAMFTRNDMFKDTAFLDAVGTRLINATNLHPLKILEAAKTYISGGSIGRSKSGHVPNPTIIAALDECLANSFTRGVHSTGQRTYVGLDVSGSMGSPISGSAVISCREAGAAVALGIAKTEQHFEVHGFTSATGVPATYMSGPDDTVMTPLPIHKRQSFDGAVAVVRNLPFGRTDCSLPMQDAMLRQIIVDTFVIVTDNETWFGSVHPTEALRAYRAKVQNPKVKLAVIAMTSTAHSIADPKDPYAMDFVGFSADTPRALEVFMKS